MKKSMLALAAASVFALFAHADEQAWFDAKIGSYTTWPSVNPDSYKGAWSNTDNVELNGTAPKATLVLDTDASAPLTFTANSGTQKDLTSQAKNVTINSEVEFNPFDSAKMPEVPADAKAGLIVVTNTTENTLQYYVLAKDEAGSTNAWTAANEAATALDAEVCIAITNKGNSVYAATYKVGDTVLTIGEPALSEIPVVMANTTVASVAYSGSGVVKSLAATYRGSDVTINIPAVANATVAVTNGTTEVATASGDVTVPMGTSLTVVYTCAPGYVFSDGVSVKTVSVASVSDSTVIDPQVTATQAEAKIGDTLYTTLASAIAAFSDQDIVVYRDLTLSAAVAINKAVKIDLGAKTITAASSAAFTVAAGADTAVVKFYNGKIVGTTGITIASGKLVIDGGSDYDYTVIEGTAGAALSFTGSENIAFEYTGTPTFKSATDYAAVVSTGIQGFLGVGDNGSARFDTGAAMSDNLVVEDYEFYVNEEDSFTYIRPQEEPATTYEVKFLDAKDGTEYTALTTNVVEDTVVIKPADPIKAGNTFVAWFDNETDAAFNFAAPLWSTKTLYATWKSDAPDPVVPGEEKKYDTEEEAKAATNNFQVGIAPAVAAVVKNEAAYKAMFKPVIVQDGDQFVVKTDFTDQAKADIQTAVDTATKAIEVGTVAGAETSDIAIANSIPGLYYQMNTASALGSLAPVDELLGDGEAITFEGVARPSTTAGFYKVSVTAAPVMTDK